MTEHRYEDWEIPTEEDVEDLAPIPPLLHSVYLEGPFRTCSVCESPLNETPLLYEIQKVFRGDQVVFEYAVCRRCGQNLLTEYSQESKTRLQEFFLGTFRPSPDTDRCHFCENPAARITGTEISVLGVCVRDRLAGPVVVICEACVERLNEQLSKKTRDIHRDFIETNFPGVPAGFDLPAPLAL